VLGWGRGAWQCPPGWFRELASAANRHSESEKIVDHRDTESDSTVMAVIAAVALISIPAVVTIMPIPVSCRSPSFWFVNRAVRLV